MTLYLPRALPLPGEIRHSEVRRCVCGGTVRADRLFPTKGVSDHNRSRVHAQWRAEREQPVEMVA